MSKKDENFDFISRQFDNENINAPDTLGEAQLLSKILNDNDEEKIVSVDNTSARRKHRIRSAVAIAAVFAIVISGGVAYPYLRDLNPKPVDEIGTVESSTVDLAHFTSEKEVNSLINKMFARDRAFEFNLAKSAEEFTADGAMGAEGGAGEGDDYGTTYKQVDSVDEADIIKTDGSYIYYIHEYAIQVYAANDGNPYRVCEISNPAFNYDSYEENGEDDYRYTYSYLEDFYLRDGKLIAVSQESEGAYNGSKSCALVQVFDITDVKNAQLIDEYRQSGYYNTSRMVGDMLYLVSDHYVYVGNKDFYIPYCGVGEAQNNLEADCIYKTASPSSASYLVLGAIDVSSGVQNTDTKAIFGASSTVYCNGDNMYITNTQGMYTYYAGYNAEYENKIQLVKARLSGGSVEFTAAGFVEGFVNDQFSMDEKDGCLRIATTTYNWSSTDEFGRTEQTNNLFVLDERLNIIGSVTGFANDESIRAVRFVGDMAYVITYQYVDPLFIIDLSNAENPQIKGSVEIDGFSSLLAPVDENTLLGIGYATSEGEFGMTTDGLKLVLFDVSNPENPQVLDFVEFNDAASEAQYNHKALVQNAQQGYFAIPITRTQSYYDEDGYYYYDENGSGVITVEPSDGTLVITNDFMVDDTTDAYSSPPRCTYIGNYVYFLDRTGGISAFDYSDNMENAVG